MWYEELFTEVEQNADSEQALKMSAYMKDNFPFLGIPKPKLTGIFKPYFANVRKDPIDWEFCKACYEKPYREAQYIAVEYILKHSKQLVLEDIDKIEYFITHKSWWETVDSFDELAGVLVIKYPKLKTRMLQWSLSDNMWLRRVAIDYQQKFKEMTDEESLSQIIRNNLNSKEFFINKAIGWSLREYAKVNPAWVKQFVEDNDKGLSPLSRKEALKNIA